MGAQTGTPQDGWIREDVKMGVIYYYTVLTDMLLALSQNKIDYLIYPTVNFNLIKDNYPKIAQKVSVRNISNDLILKISLYLFLLSLFAEQNI